MAESTKPIISLKEELTFLVTGLEKRIAYVESELKEFKVAASLLDQKIEGRVAYLEIELEGVYADLQREWDWVKGHLERPFTRIFIALKRLLFKF